MMDNPHKFLQSANGEKECPSQTTRFLLLEVPMNVQGYFRRVPISTAGLLIIVLGIPVCKAEPPTFYSGGFIGMQSLAVPENSAKYRQAGGNLYIHNSGWGTLNSEQKEKITSLFKNSKTGIEIGYGKGKQSGGWPTLIQREYVDAGIHAHFFLVNCFSTNTFPSKEAWQHFVSAIQAKTSSQTPVVPIIGYPNVNRGNKNRNDEAMINHMVSNFLPFQQIIRESHAIALDAPGNYFFGRNQVYKNWITDAISWSRSRRYTVYLILSPHQSGLGYLAASERFLNYLQTRGLMPDVVVSENFLNPPPAGFINVVGSDLQPFTTLGVGLRLLDKYH
jgi:hypothetical protein